jgi:hypothetical protein
MPPVKAVAWACEGDTRPRYHRRIDNGTWRHPTALSRGLARADAAGNGPCGRSGVSSPRSVSHLGVALLPRVRQASWGGASLWEGEGATALAQAGATLAQSGGRVAVGGGGPRAVLFRLSTTVNLGLRVSARSRLMGPDLGLVGPGREFLLS